MNVCARCRRPLTREPVLVNGHGYGPRCAEMVGDLLTKLTKRKRLFTVTQRRTKDERQVDWVQEVRS